MTDLIAQPPRLLSDDEVLCFVTHGYHLLHPEYPRASTRRSPRSVGR